MSAPPHRERLLHLNNRWNNHSMLPESTPPPFIAFLQRRLQKPLPGYEGQRLMAPLPARTYLPPEGAAYRESAVMALLCSSQSSTLQQEIELVLTLRSSDLKSHSGQLSFAGGRKEGSESIIETALRETYEEIGVSPQMITTLGKLSPMYVPVSQSFIHVVVGYTPQKPQIITNTTEVDEVLFVPIDKFLEPAIRATERRELLGREVDVPMWRVHPRVPLWGATAMMVSELIALYQEFLQGHAVEW